MDERERDKEKKIKIKIKKCYYNIFTIFSQ